MPLCSKSQGEFIIEEESAMQMV